MTDQEKPRTSRRKERVAEVLGMRQDDLTVILANIHDPHNVSAIYRSCDAFGVSLAHLYYTKTAFPQLGRKTSASARKWVETKRHTNAVEMLDSLKKEGFQILATSFRPGSLDFRQCDFLKPTAIILGNEHEGVEEELLLAADGEIHIPMRGMIQSLNVSVAAAVLLAEAARQREAVGFYQRPLPDTPAFRNRLEEWLKK